jgi:hypothetical protein
MLRGLLSVPGHTGVDASTDNVNSLVGLVCAEHAALDAATAGQ